MDCEITPGTPIEGTLFIPPSKSHTHRAILFASLAEGTSTLHNYLDSPDSDALIDICRLIGAKLTKRKTSLIVEGTTGKIHSPEDVLNVGNSGIALRFITALAALGSTPIVITGDTSIRHQRPMESLLKALNGLGVGAVSTRGNGYAPLIVQGPVTTANTTVFGADSQPVSALLMLGAFSPIPLEFEVLEPGEIPWVQLTLSWLDFLHVPYTHSNFTHYKVGGGPKIQGFDFHIPGDMSSAAFPVTAAVTQGSSLVVNGLDFNDAQGDKQYFDLLKQMGAKLKISADQRSLEVLPGSQLKGISVSVNGCIDALCALAVAACYAEGETVIQGASVARTKECDRIRMLVEELSKMGAHIQETEDGLYIQGTPLRGAVMSSHDDHRMAMALAVAGLRAEGKSRVCGMDCVNKTYTSFIKDFKSLGAQLYPL